MIRLPDRKQTFMIIGVVILVSPMIFTTLMVLIKPEFVSDPTLRATLILLNLGLIMSLVMAIISAKGLLVQFAQRLYSLSLEDAEGLVNRILYGLPAVPPFDPTLRVDRGRVDPDGPEVLRKLGGPGFLSIGHDSAVVIARGGTIVDILGPGFHHLDPFLKVWDVVDLRPQHRRIKIEANTRDGIPVYCEVKMRFRIENGESYPEGGATPYPFTELAKKWALEFTTTRAVLAPGSKTPYSDWENHIANGIVDGQVRDHIEQFRLDELLEADEKRNPSISKLEGKITSAVKESARALGVRIEEIHLGPILPAEDAISRQWLEAWRSEWEKRTAEDKVIEAAKETHDIEKARIHAQAELIIKVVEQMRSLHLENPEMLPTLILPRFFDVIRTFTEGDSVVRSTVFLQAENLERVILPLITAIQPPQDDATQSGGLMPRRQE